MRKTFFIPLKIGNSRALLLYSLDATPSASSPPANNLISIQVDSITLNEIIGNTEASAKVVKKINFRDVNGFVNLVKGESSKFSFFEDSGKAVCDAVCDVKCKQILPSTTTPPRAFVSKKDSISGPKYLPPTSFNNARVEKKDEAVTPRKTSSYYTPARSTSSPATTIRPKVQVITRETARVQITTREPVKVQTTTRSAPTQTSQRTTTRRRSTPGPAYLPLEKKSTARRPKTTERSYPPATWPSSTRVYTHTFAPWSAPIRRSTEAKFTSSTPKYLYREPSNALVYAGEKE